MKRLIDAIFGTLFIFLVIFVVERIPLSIEFLDPVFDAIEDLEVTDQVFSKLRLDQGVDTNIVLVNIERLSRAEIAMQIEQINKHEPAAIGIDAFFRKEKDPSQDFPLMMAMAQAKNLVLVSEMDSANADASCFNHIALSHPNFMQFANHGFANMRTGEQTIGYRTVREFIPQFCVGDSVALNFAAKLAQFKDPEAVDYLLSRNHESEVINWRGHFNRFYALEGKDVMEGNIGVSLKNKIVLMGYIGDRLGDKESLVDIFYTPLNERAAGRAYPDMYGVVVHANVVSMILSRRYIDQWPLWQRLILAYLVALFNVYLFIIISEKYRLYYDLVTKSIQLVQAVILLFITVYCLNYFNVKIDMTYPLIGVLLTSDLTEVYSGSVRDLVILGAKKIGLRSMGE